MVNRNCRLQMLLAEPHSSVCRLKNMRSPARPVFFPSIGDRIHSSLTAVRCLDNGYVGKEPVAWKEYCAEYWLKELQESMDRCTSCRDLTEILLKTALKTKQSINQANVSQVVEWVDQNHQFQTNILQKVVSITPALRMRLQGPISLISIETVCRLTKRKKKSRRKVFDDNQIYQTNKNLFLERQKTLCENVKMLITCIFSFSHNVFKCFLYLRSFNHWTVW